MLYHQMLYNVSFRLLFCLLNLIMLFQAACVGFDYNRDGTTKCYIFDDIDIFDNTVSNRPRIDHYTKCVPGEGESCFALKYL